MLFRNGVVCVLLLCTVAAVMSDGSIAYAGVIAAPTDDPYSRPRETGLVGNVHLQEMQKYNSVGPGGDLSVNIPLYTLPGKILMSVNWAYQSGCLNPNLRGGSHEALQLF